MQPIDVDTVGPSQTSGGLWAAIVRLYPALSVPGFRLMWSMSFPSTMCWSICNVATGYAALTLSGSATALGVVTSLGGLPMLVLAPLGGVVADRFPRKTVIFVAQAILMAGALALAVLSVFNMMEVWHLGALGLIQGVAFSFNMPSRQSLLMEVVGPRLTRSAAAMNTIAPNFSRVVGPSVAGVMLATPWIGIAGVFLAMVVMYGIVMVSLYWLPPSQRPPRDDGGVRAVWDSLLEGFRYILGSPLHRGLLGSAFVLLVLGAPVLQIMPVFSEHVFDVGATGLGLLLSANGIGALIGTFGVATLAGFRRLGLIQVGLGFGFALSIIGFALAPSMPVAVVMAGAVRRLPGGLHVAEQHDADGQHRSAAVRSGAEHQPDDVRGDADRGAAAGLGLGPGGSANGGRRVWRRDGGGAGAAGAVQPGDPPRPLT